MSKHYAGPYSKPSGKAGGLVWGAARTQQGKIATAREYVIPADPNTPDQQETRTIFKSAVDICGNLGAAVWQEPWNNTLGELQGYSSIMSYLIDNQELTDTIPSIVATPGPKSLGPVHMPVIGYTVAGASQYTLDWDDEIVGDHAALTDDFMGFILNQATPANWEIGYILQPGTVTRAAETYITPFDVLEDGVGNLSCFWFRHDPGGGAPLEYSPIYARIDVTGA